MAPKYRWADKIMVSSYKEETAYGTKFPTYSATNYHTLQEATLAISYDDEVRVNSQGDGTEFGSEQYLTRKDVRMTLTIDNLRPHDAGWLTAFAMGVSDPTQDGTDVAYAHKNTLIATQALSSFTILASEGGEQNTYTGCVIDTLTISSDNGGYLQAVAEIIGCGWREQDTQDFPATITETPFRSNDVRIWGEVGADTDIQTFALTDGTCTLVAGTGSLVLTNIVYGGWSWILNNNLRADQGYQVTANSATDNWCRGACDRGAKREVTIELNGMAMESDDWEDYPLAVTTVFGIATHMAIEINCWAEDDGKIDAGGTYYHQFAVYCPRMSVQPVGATSDDDGVVTRDIKLTMRSPASEEGTGITATTAVFVQVLCAATAFMA